MKQLNGLRLLTSVMIGLLLITLPGLAIAETQVKTPAESNLVSSIPVQPAPVIPGGLQQGPPPAPPGQRGPRNPIGYLSGPAAGDPLDIALSYLRQNRQRLGLTADDLADIVVKDRYVSRHNGVTHLYLRQRLAGVEVFNGDININIDRDGRVINLGNHFVADLKNVVQMTGPSLSAIEAVQRAAGHLNLTITAPLVPRRDIGGPAREVMLSNGGISLEDIPVKLEYQPIHNQARLAWKVVIRLKNGQNWWNLRVDAVTGEVLAQNDWIAQDSYDVFALPKESPSDGPRTLVANPADALASPFGWHDTNGIAGAEFTDTRGNNVFAQEDVDGNDNGGSRPNGGDGLNFSFGLDLNSEPSGYRNAAITNLFYWNNILHDLHYQYGFDEASGNFQQNSYGRGGLGGDPVQADAQDGSGIDNANFGTPPDGADPRMQMFVWTFTTPNRDSDLDNGIIIHEYGHGVSTRLTGGPSNVDCLFGVQSGGMGEGWSDWWSLALTAVPTDTSSTSRGVGTYILGQPANGPGIRAFPYSTDLAINPLTYGNLFSTGGEVHSVGEIWATTLWDMYWNLVADHGFDPDFYTGSGGNNLAMQLVMDGLKFQPCNPTFLDARDAILTADLVDTGGANQCSIWEAFSKRGMGINADDGGDHNNLIITEDFDLQPSCLDELVLTKYANPAPAYVGKVVSYTLVAGNYTSDTLTGVAITDTVPMSTIYIPGSASNGGTESGGVVQWLIGTMPPDTVVTRTFQVSLPLDFNTDPVTLFFDDLEGGGGHWTATGLWHLETDGAACGNSFSPVTSWYYGQSPGCTYDTGGSNSGQLTTAAPIALPMSLGNMSLTFQSWEMTEAFLSYDSRRVLVSTDGTNFTPVFDSTNDTGAWYEAAVDLSAYAGQTIWLRFDFDTLDDFANDFPGWYVDDIRLTGEPAIVNTAYVSSNQGQTDSVTINTPVIHAAELAYAPTRLEEFLRPGQIVTRTLIINNVGTGPLNFVVSEAPGAVLADLTLSPQPTGVDPNAERNIAPGWGNVATPPAIHWLEPVNSAAAQLPVIIDDPAGDANTIDVTTVGAASTLSEMTMRLGFKSGSGPVDAFGYVHLDTDQNAATGLPPSALFGLPEQDIGFDYVLSLFSLPERVDVFDANSIYIGSVAPIVTTDALEFTLPLSFLGHDDGFMDVTTVLGDFFGPTDWAPDVGHGTIFDAPWLRELPIIGNASPGNNQLVQVIFDSTAVSQTGTYKAQLRFSGNMVNSVAPLPVIMHVSASPDPTDTTIYLPIIAK